MPTPPEPPSEIESESSSREPDSDKEHQLSVYSSSNSPSELQESAATTAEGVEDLPSDSEEPRPGIIPESSKPDSSATVPPSGDSSPRGTTLSALTNPETSATSQLLTTETDRKETTRNLESDNATFPLPSSSGASSKSPGGHSQASSDMHGKGTSADVARSGKRKMECLGISPTSVTKTRSKPSETSRASEPETSTSRSLGSSNVSTKSLRSFRISSLATRKRETRAHNISAGTEEVESKDPPALTASILSQHFKPKGIGESTSDTFHSPSSSNGSPKSKVILKPGEGFHTVGASVDRASAGGHEMEFEDVPAMSSVSFSARPPKPNIGESTEMKQSEGVVRPDPCETITISSDSSSSNPSVPYPKTDRRSSGTDSSYRMPRSNFDPSLAFCDIEFGGSASSSPYRAPPSNLSLPGPELEGSASSSPTSVPIRSAKSGPCRVQDFPDLGDPCEMVINAFSFEWEVSRDEKCAKGSSQQSESFYAGIDSKTKWSLRFYPNGMDDAEDLDTSLRLVLEKGDPKGEVVTEFFVKRHDIAQPIYHSIYDARTFKETGSLGIANFVRKRDIGKEVITIICKLRINCDEIHRKCPYSYIVEDLIILSNDFLSMFKNGLNCDGKVTVGGGASFAVHKFFLSARSDRFSKMFANQTYLVFDSYNTIEMEDLLTYIYSGKVRDWNADETKRMIEVASYFGVPDLHKKCLMLDKLNREP